MLRLSKLKYVPSCPSSTSSRPSNTPQHIKEEMIVGPKTPTLVDQDTWKVGNQLFVVGPRYKILNYLGEGAYGMVV